MLKHHSELLYGDKSRVDSLIASSSYKSLDHIENLWSRKKSSYSWSEFEPHSLDTAADTACDATARRSMLACWPSARLSFCYTPLSL